ncbi:TIGR02281 family clan AA aspartic protease [Pseudooceanicola sp. 216_PA32_1]|uniref:TIGR02281 family clan AA aspartic protease n=1 Tax=Pseudooceanicola pacificus TaxID=2676438 RepID=A0A844WE82_9RHOB|nr:TIGR02281 family clan AA aspartic protease [Pseudooceanicola pacificus]MWB77259.1 TIGR02281 family clan AA aspartic protease [Pseudooceanicola pacificus]
MSTDTIMQIAYLSLLMAAIGGYAVVRYRGRLGTMLQHAALWALIFVGVLAGVGLWGDIRTTVMPMQSVSQTGETIRVPRANDGHYYLTVDINGEPIWLMVDTGATDLVLTRRDAEKVGIDPDALQFLGRASTANGEVGLAPVTLDSVDLGPVHDSRFRAFVSEGAMPMSLMGMSYLQNFSRIEIADGALVLTR